MNFAEVILTSLVTSTGAISLAIWLGKALILERLRASVAHEFNEKLANLNSELKRGEAVLESFRSAVLANRSKRQEHVAKRRIEAIDQIWEAATIFGSMRGIVQMISFIKLDALANELSKNVQAQKQFGMLKPDMDKISKATGLAAQARPHVTIETWAYYSAYAALVALAASQYNMAVLGFAPEKYVDGKAVVKLVRQALPHLDKYLDENGLSGAYAALDQLEAQLLVAISKMLDGVDEQEKDIRR